MTLSAKSFSAEEYVKRSGILVSGHSPHNSSTAGEAALAEADEDSVVYFLRYGPASDNLSDKWEKAKWMKNS